MEGPTPYAAHAKNSFLILLTMGDGSGVDVKDRLSVHRLAC